MDWGNLIRMVDRPKRDFFHPHPVFVLAAVFLGDRCGHFFWGDVTLAPLLSTFGLAYLALFYRPWTIVFWTPFFSGLSFLLLTYWRGWLPSGLTADFVPLPMSMGRAWVRSLTVFSVGLLSSVLSHQRMTLQVSSAEILSVIRCLPQGVLISDRAGRIVFANHKAIEILQIPSDVLLASSYFSLFATKEGNTAELYGRVAEQPHAEPTPMVYASRQDPSKQWSVSLFSFRGPSEVLLTTLF